MKVNGRHLLVVLAMCGLSAGSVGLVTNIAGVFFTPMAEEFGVLRGSVSLTLTIANTCSAFSALATRRLTKMMPLRVLLLISGVLLAGSTLLIALAPSLALIYVLFAIRGLAAGVAGFVLIAYVLNKWFVSQLGLMTSIAMGFSGLAGALFTPLVQPVVESGGWRAGMVLVAAIHAALYLPAILLVPSTDPTDVGLRPFGLADNKQTVSAHHDKSKPIKVDMLVFVGAVCYSALSSAVSAMPQHFPGLAEEMGFAVATGAAMISACMVANTAGKIVMGWLCDHFGALVSIMAYSVVVVLSIVAFFVVRTPIAFVIAAFFFGMCYSRGTVGTSMMCRELFGKRGFGIVYPVASLGTSISNAVFSSLVGYSYDLTGSYALSLVTFLAFLIASAAITALCYRRAVMGVGQVE